MHVNRASQGRDIEAATIRVEQTQARIDRASSRHIEVTMYKDGAELMPGIATVAALGHTVGHTMIRVSSAGKELLLWGDIVHNAALQFPEPDRAFAGDTDQTTAIASRKRVLDMVAKDKLMIAGAHLPFPGLGHVAKASTGYAYVPAVWGEDF